MSQTLQIAIPEELDAEIRKRAQRGRMSTDEWVRRAIVQALTEKPVTTDPIEELGSLNAPTGEIEEILAQIDSGRS